MNVLFTSSLGRAFTEKIIHPATRWTKIRISGHSTAHEHCALSFPLSISSVNVTKSAGYSGFGQIYWINTEWKASFSWWGVNWLTKSINVNARSDSPFYIQRLRNSNRPAQKLFYKSCYSKFLCLFVVIITSRSSRLEVFCKKSILRDIAKFTGKRICQSLFFNKIPGLRPTTLLKKRIWYRCYPVNFAKVLRTHFLTEHLRWLVLFWLTS